jgi:GNAT superfamily N-acetyltransferase
VPFEVHPATEDRFDDVATLLAPRGGPACWCLYWRLSSGDYNRVGHADRPAFVRGLTRQCPPPGLLAYEDGEPAGWCGFGPRAGMERLQRSRTIPAVDDSPVWSVVCFLVRPGFRRRGVTRVLLDGVIDYARAAGAPGLEAYPVDPAGGRIHQAAAYVGTTDLFEAAGFHRVTGTRATSGRLPRWLMRLDLRSEPVA